MRLTRSKYHFIFLIAILTIAVSFSIWALLVNVYGDDVSDNDSSTIAANHLKDGEYTIKVTLSGGSGRAHIESPAKIKVKDGKLTARIRWSSEYYQYIQIGDQKYNKINKKGKSYMDIPVVLDQDINIQALTTAMSMPHLINYTIRFDSTSLKKIEKTRDKPSSHRAFICGGSVILICMAGACIYRSRKKSGYEN